MTAQIVRNRDVAALRTAAGWPGADRATVITLALRLASVRADDEGYEVFQQQSDAHPDDALPLALAGFFQARVGDDIEAAVAKLDKAVAAEPGVPHYFRGIALAMLPPDMDRARTAVDDLRLVLALRDRFPSAMMRAVHRCLAIANTTLGNDDLAAESAENAGLRGLPADSQLLFGSYWATAEDGFRFGSPMVIEPAPGVHVLQGYDFCDFAIIETRDGIVAIDAGSTPDRVRVALDELGLSGDVSHLILTHSHFDHVGGVSALIGPRTRVITHTAFPAEQARQRSSALPFSYFFGRGGGLDHHVVPDRLVSEPESLTVGGVEIVLYPTSGGETDDALMVHLPASGLLFTGDVMMPYLGAPFFAEGSPEGLLDVCRQIRELGPSMLIHGHTPLTENFTMAAIPGLEAALTELHGHVLDDIQRGRTLAEILERNDLPESLRAHPKAVTPYVIVRENFASRMHHQRTGYWQQDGQGLEPLSRNEHAAALDLLAGGRADAFVAAATTLLDQGDHALALALVEPGLLRYPSNTALADLRRAALLRALEEHQQLNPFKFLIYAELAGVEIGPAK
ncbi:MAG TPA: MBL fold metallo-hydrolase [Pseudonocardiaceae bacterium]|nr:MBL fold metallo-hydrolase [Pseudonocardiaceae bacterium]